MLDAYPVVKEMREKYPRQFDTLTKVPVTFYRVHHSHNNPCDMKFARPHIVLDKDGQVGEDPPFNCHNILLLDLSHKLESTWSLPSRYT